MNEANSFNQSPGGKEAALIQRIAAAVNNDSTTGQIRRALKKYENSIGTMIYTLQKVFTAVSETANVSQQIDASWYFFCESFTIQTSSTDTDQYITALQVSSETSLVTGNLPILILSRLTGMFQPLEQVWPANTQIVLSLQNGATTAATTVRTTFFGKRVPAAFVESLRKK